MTQEVSKATQSKYWLFSCIACLIAVVVIGYEWSQVESVYQTKDIVRNQQDVEKALEKRDAIQFQQKEEPYMIPTGYFIQNIAFITPSDVNVNGYIWQTYPKNFPKKIEKGIVFPEEVNSANTILREVYRYERKQNNTEHELIGWYFDVTVRQSFDYSNYPLDILTAWLKIWPKDMNYDERLLLVPDFDAYAEITKKKYGIDEYIVQGEWDIDETFFSYKNSDYNTNFGYLSKGTQFSYKNFFINVVFKRKFINAFVINLVPLFVVAILLLAQMLMNSNNESKASKFGFSTSGSLGACSALFFVVMLSHVQVRSLFAGSPLVYIEYFYLIMYGAILLSALNVYLFSLEKSRFNSLVHYADNLLPKVLFMPVLLWSLVIITSIKL